MAKVTTRNETGKLVIDFTYRGVRCREQTALADTPTHRRRVAALVVRLKKELSNGSFNYGQFFPGSRLATRFGAGAMAPVAPTPAVLPTRVSTEASSVLSPEVVPLFADFTEQWVREHSVEWRRSHVRTLRSTLDRYLLPRFGEVAVSRITKSDVFLFRADLAKLPGRKNAARHPDVDARLRGPAPAGSSD